MLSQRTVHRSLTRQLLQHLCRPRQPITRLADGDVEHELLDTQLAHGVAGFVLAAARLGHILAVGLLC